MVQTTPTPNNVPTTTPVAAKKDKQTIVDEVWTLTRVEAFLDLIPPAGVNTDFHVLKAAYQSMRIENFEQFLDFFSAKQRNINAQDNNGTTLLQLVQQHRRSSDYAKALINAGAI